MQRTHDGLELVPDSGVMAAWLKPEADFSVYQRVMILEATVAFRKNWLMDQNRRSVHRVTNRDVQRIKGEVATQLHEVFVAEMSSDGGMEVVDAPDTDVLLLRPAIIDLDVVAPETQGMRRTHNLVRSAGAATLYLEMFDSVSGEIMGRVVDRQEAAETGDVMRLATSASNRADAERLLAGWARQLRQALDELRGVASPDQ